MNKRLTMLTLLFVAVALLAACGSQEPDTIRLLTHDSFSVSEEVLQAFEQETGITVELLPAGDTGTVLNQAILSKDDPLADVIFGIDNTFMSRALAADLFVPYDSPLLERIPAGLQLDPENRLLPVDYGDVCLNYDRTWFEEQNLALPDSLEALADPTYADLLVVENPATSSPGLAFMLATIGHFGEDAYLDYWADLRDNGVLVSDGWEDAYWGQFSGASEGDRPLVVSYATSPPVEVYYGELDESPTGSIVAPDTCFRQIEFVGILKGDAGPQGVPRAGRLFARDRLSGGPALADVHVPGRSRRRPAGYLCRARQRAGPADRAGSGRH